MRLIPSLKLAITSLNAHKMRSVLTMLGIIIGVASVITMVSIGQGARDKIDSEIRAMGTNLMMIFPSGGRGPVRSADSAMPGSCSDSFNRPLPIPISVRPAR